MVQSNSSVIDVENSSKKYSFVPIPDALDFHLEISLLKEIFAIY